MAIAVCKFSKISGGGVFPRTPLVPFLLLRLLEIKSVEKNLRLKSDEN